MKTKRFEMPALYADHHVAEVRRILLGLPGVSEVYASSAFQIVDVEYDEKTTNEAELTAKLEEAGYLGELAVPVERGESDTSASAPFFRHSAVYETTKKTVAFAQQVSYQGRPLWPCPGMGTLKAPREETQDA